MSAVFVKYCALCGQENLALASFCERCDADLMNVQVEMRREPDTATTENDTIPEPVVPASEATPNDGLVPNNGLASTVFPDALAPDPLGAKHDESEVATRRVAQAPRGVLELELVANPTLRFSVQSGQSVGRSARADVVLAGMPDLEYISRVHARFLQRRTQWYVQYVAEGNSISVDGVQSTDDSEIALYDESIVVLSFTSFRVRLR